MSELTKQEFTVAVHDAITAVRHLYREVDLLILGLREQLSAMEALRPVPGTLGKSGRGTNRLTVRFEYGVLFGLEDPNAELEDDNDGEGDGDGDGNDEEDVEVDNGDIAAPRRRIIELTEQRLLCLRISLHPQKPNTSFEPSIEYAIMDQWKIGDTPIPPGTSAPLRSQMLKKIPPSLADRTDNKPGTPLRTRARAHKATGQRAKGGKGISCRLPQGVQSIPLYELKDLSRLSQLAEGMALMWRASEL